MTCCLSLDSAWSTSFVRKTPWRICLSGHLCSRSCNSRTILSNSFHSKPRHLSTTSSVRLLDFQVFRREFQLSTRRLHPDILQKPEIQCIKNKLPFHLHAQTSSSPLLPTPWAPSHIHSATNSCQFHRANYVMYLSPIFTPYSHSYPNPVIGSKKIKPLP